MEKTREIEVKKTKCMHTFICDKCGKVIGETPEYEDGYYVTLGKEINLRIGASVVYGLLCDECSEKFEKEVNKAAKEIAERNGLQVKGFGDWCNC